MAAFSLPTTGGWRGHRRGAELSDANRFLQSGRDKIVNFSKTAALMGALLLIVGMDPGPLSVSGKRDQAA